MDNSTTLTKQPSTDWGHCALLHFFSNFVLRSENGFPGFFEFLPELYSTSTEASCFRSAAQAISLAHFSLVKRMGSEHLRKSRNLYITALRELGSTLRGPEAGSPEVLGTVALLWQYDVRRSLPLLLRPTNFILDHHG